MLKLKQLNICLVKLEKNDRSRHIYSSYFFRVLCIKSLLYYEAFIEFRFSSNWNIFYTAGPIIPPFSGGDIVLHNPTAQN